MEEHVETAIMQRNIAVKKNIFVFQYHLIFHFSSDETPSMAMGANINKVGKHVY